MARAAPQPHCTGPRADVCGALPQALRQPTPTATCVRGERVTEGISSAAKCDAAGIRCRPSCAPRVAGRTAGCADVTWTQALRRAARAAMANVRVGSANAAMAKAMRRGADESWRRAEKMKTKEGERRCQGGAVGIDRFMRGSRLGRVAMSLSARHGHRAAASAFPHPAQAPDAH